MEVCAKTKSVGTPYVSNRSTRKHTDEQAKLNSEENNKK